MTGNIKRTGFSFCPAEITTMSFVLVTGVSGFTGAHVVNQLIKEGYRVRG
jgi:hypothetical protein